MYNVLLAQLSYVIPSKLYFCQFVIFNVSKQGIYNDLIHKIYEQIIPYICWYITLVKTYNTTVEYFLYYS